MDELESESSSWDDAYFELELGPHDEADEFEFRVSISAVVPFPAGLFHPTTITNHHHHAATATAPTNIDLTPTQIATTTNTTCRKTIAGKMNRSTMMKLLVKLRSIISVRGRVCVSFDRWFGRRSEEFEMVRRPARNLFGGVGSNKIKSTSIIPSPLPQLGHHTSLLHAAIAHCNKSSSFSFSL